MFCIFSEIKHIYQRLDAAKTKGMATSTFTNVIETFRRIGLVRYYGNLQSYWTNTKL
jgi:hypothetical protein